LTAPATTVVAPPAAPSLRFDIVAGLVAATVVLPKAMAYATVAGLPVSVGLYTSLLPMVIYALLGTSRVLSVSSTTTIAILTGTQLGLVVPDGDPARLLTATATLTALVGAMLVVARIARLGFVANFVSLPVLTGFKTGIGLVIVVDQLPKLFGLHITKHGFFTDIVSIAQHLPDTSVPTLAVAAASLVVLVGMERLLPHSPAPLVVVGGAIAVLAAQQPADRSWTPGVQKASDASPVLSPEEEMKQFYLPPGFHAELVAAEPLIQDPIAIDWDPDGRMWVVEYPEYVPDLQVGEYAIVHVGFALQRLDEKSALETLEIFRKMGELDAEFGDQWGRAAEQAGMPRPDLMGGMS